MPESRVAQPALLALLALAACALPAAAATCEEGFQAVGDARNGLFFVASVNVADLRIGSGLAQLRALARAGGYEPGADLVQGNEGEMSFVQASSHPPLVVRATVKSSGEVTLGLKLAQGQLARPEDVRQEFCGMLSKLQGGRAGDALAATERAAAANAITETTAEALSEQVGKDVKSTLKPVATKGNFSRWLIGTGPVATDADFNAAFGPIRAKYIGRKYRIDGQVYTATRNTVTGDMEVNYLVTPSRGLLGIRQESRYNNLNFQIQCTLARDQAKLFATLANGDFVKLSGEVTQIQPGGMVLGQCRQAN